MLLYHSPAASNTPLRLIAVFSACLMAQGCFASFGSAKPDIAIKQSVTPEKTIKTGWEYMDQGAYSAAARAFRVALSEAPENEDLKFGLAEAYRHAGHLQLAESQYALLLQSAEYRGEALTGIGHVKLLSHDADGARDLFSTAVAEDPAAWKAWLGLAQLHDLARDWEAADQAYQQALANTDNRALVLNNLGISMIARGDAKEALAYLELAASTGFDLPRVQTNIDLARAMHNDDAKAVREDHLDSKTRARKLNNRGYVAMLRGDSANAERYFLEAIDAHPSFYATAHKNLQTLRTAKAGGR